MNKLRLKKHLKNLPFKKGPFFKSVPGWERLDKNDALYIYTICLKKIILSIFIKSLFYQIVYVQFRRCNSHK